MAKFLRLHAVFVLAVGTCAWLYLGVYAFTSPDATHRQREFAYVLAVMFPASLWRYHQKFLAQDSAEPQQQS